MCAALCVFPCAAMRVPLPGAQPWRPPGCPRCASFPLLSPPASLLPLGLPRRVGSWSYAWPWVQHERRGGATLFLLGPREPCRCPVPCSPCVPGPVEPWAPWGFLLVALLVTVSQE